MINILLVTNCIVPLRVNKVECFRKWGTADRAFKTFFSKLDITGFPQNWEVSNNSSMILVKNLAVSMAFRTSSAI